MHQKISVLTAALALALAGCHAPTSNSSAAVPNASSTRFAVMTDLHYYDPALGTTSPEFQAYVAGDRKMVALSQDLLAAAVSDIKAQKPDFVLIPGDLTKDGELQDHQQVAAQLETLKTQGIQAYVICGNHDINNPAALGYTTSPPVSVPNVDPIAFKKIYADFGYSTALAQDPSSLSYVVEPVKGLWVIAIDSCEYANNATNVDLSTGKPAPVTAGQIPTATLNWILGQLTAAKAQGKTVIGMMHHGLLEHFTGQSNLFADYVVTGWKSLSQNLSTAGLNVVFTGHFHANDVTYQQFSTPASVLYDIETGSLVTAPCPYRYVAMDLVKSTLTVTTSHVTSVAHLPAGYADFTAYSQNFLFNGLAAPVTTPGGSGGLVPQMMSAPTQYGGMGLPVAEANQLAPLVSFALMAHYYGDEKALANAVSSADVNVQVSASATAPLSAVAGSIWTGVQTAASAGDPGAQTLQGLITNVWNDLPPPDNNFTFTLNTANVTSK